jgi:membrane protease YdiL (CAAX protease family)
VGAVRRSCRTPQGAPGVDPGGPPGRPAGPVRAAGHYGFLTGPPPGDADGGTVAAAREGFAVAVFGFAAGLVLSAVTAAIAEAGTHYRVTEGAPLPVVVTVADLLGLWVGLVGAAVWWSRTRGTGSLVTDYGCRIGAWWDVPVGAGVGLACQYWLIPVMYRPFEQVDRSLSRQLGQPTQRDVGAAHGSISVAVLLLALAVGAPLVEELFFRGLLLRSLSRWTNPPVAVVATAILFGLAHFEKVQFAGLAVFGMILGLLARRSRRLAPSVAAHSAFNAVAVLSVVHLH